MATDWETLLIFLVQVLGIAVIGCGAFEFVMWRLLGKQKGESD